MWPLIKILPVKTNFRFVAFARIAAILSVIAVIASFAKMLIPFELPCGGLNCGIDFRGGIVLELSTAPEPVDVGAVRGTLSAMGLGGLGRWLAIVLTWAVLVAGLGLGLAMLYRYAPNRPEPRWWWVSPGAVLALVLWLVGSILFSLYTSNFGSYNETYGSLGAVVVVMLWLFITALSILLGAELNAEVEQRSTRSVARDSA